MANKKLEKDSSVEFEVKTKELRDILTEQTKYLDVHTEQEIVFLGDISDFFRKRADLESDYARGLDKLSEKFLSKQKGSFGVSGHHMFGAYNIFYQFLNLTRAEGLSRSTLSSMFSDYASLSIQHQIATLKQLYNLHRQSTISSHEQLIGHVRELQSSMKKYQRCNAIFLQHEAKLHSAQRDLDKARAVLAKKSGGSSNSLSNSKTRSCEKAYNKENTRYLAALDRVNTHRNDYLLNMQAINAAVNKMFNEDIVNSLNIYHLGFYETLKNVFGSYLDAHAIISDKHSDSVRSLSSCRDNLDACKDIQRLIEQNSSLFCVPVKFEFRSNVSEALNTLVADEALLQRQNHIHTRIRDEEVQWKEQVKTLQCTHDNISSTLKNCTLDVPAIFKSNDTRPLKEHTEKLSGLLQNLTELQQFHINKQTECINRGNILTRLIARRNLIEASLGNVTRHQVGSYNTIARKGGRVVRKHLTTSKINPVSRPKLFGGSIEEYCVATNQEIPQVALSCIQFLSCNAALLHQGLFRVSGSKADMRELKSAFEKGEDPIEERGTMYKDYNAVGDLLKHYIRELNPSLFPCSMFHDFMEIYSTYIENGYHEALTPINALRDLVTSVNYHVMVTQRYLFAYLSNVTTRSDENMMDSYNLAVCFAPTIMPVPPDESLTVYQGKTISLVKFIIDYQHEIFPQDSGLIYDEEDDTVFTTRSGSCSEDGELDRTDDDINSNTMGSLVSDTLSSQVSGYWHSNPCAQQYPCDETPDLVSNLPNDNGSLNSSRSGALRYSTNSSEERISPRAFSESPIQKSPRSPKPSE